MANNFSLHIDAWAHGAAIPARFAFGRPGEESPFAPSDNLNPTIRWSNAPQGTRSFALICHDPDVPSAADDVNQVGKLVPADLPRVDFFHWVLVDIPATTAGIDEGAASSGITARGKALGATEFGITGKNDYSAWFDGDTEMQGIYGGYDGPCPPWNDSILHHYYFTVYALDTESLGCQGAFSGQQALQAMQGHILAKAAHMGTYTMNPRVV
ncbi:MAG: YbhB/YbcL family Raf kinase inhibitor-like protein [Cellvibrionaceae bacterium]|nr:YbhB/YbcL family Raf kinase inhibitor-like protein [Cellvibrionaceae bacterium]